MIFSGAGLVPDAKIKDVSSKNKDDLLGNEEDKNITQYKGFFIKQKSAEKLNNNESSTDPETAPVQKGFYRKPANMHHRF